MWKTNKEEPTNKSDWYIVEINGEKNPMLWNNTNKFFAAFGGNAIKINEIDRWLDHNHEESKGDKELQISWSEEKDPNNDWPYNHISCETPIGEFVITWKGWKSQPSFDVWIDGGAHIDMATNLDDAKECVHFFISDIEDKINGMYK